MKRRASASLGREFERKIMSFEMRRVPPAEAVAAMLAGQKSSGSDILDELVAKLVGDEAEESCLVCGCHHDLDHVTYDGDTSCVVSRLLVARRAGIL